MTKRSPIQQFYAGSKVFITGATGFLGGILLEKLLRSCSDIETIYLLMRPKKGLSLETRLNNLFQDIAFQRLQNEQPDFRNRIVPISGDCEQKNLGISPEDIQLLIENVNIVFHLAATVNFDETLQKAILINIRGARDVIAICRKMKNLKFVTHVSTAYVNTKEGNVEFREEFGVSPYSIEQMIGLAESFSADTISKLAPIIMAGFPNTYTFTKTVVEDCISKCTDLPIAVFRPAIVVSTYKEPVPGWINNFYGPQGVSAAAMVGLLRTLHCNEENCANIVPVDMCVNALISIPWKCRPRYLEVVKYNDSLMENEVQKEKYEIPIYQYESNTYNNINWKRFRYLTHLYGQLCVSKQVIGIYHFHLRKNIVSHTLAVLFLHLLPALLVDGVLMLVGKKPMLWEGYRKVHKFSKVLEFFITKQLNFQSSKMLEIWSDLSEPDKQIFFSDLRELNWDHFFQDYLKGCRVYLLKDPIETVPAARIKYLKIQAVTYSVILIFGLLVCWCLYFIYNLAAPLLSAV